MGLLTPTLGQSTLSHVVVVVGAHHQGSPGGGGGYCETSTEKE